MKTCPYCGAVNREDAFTCYACGNGLGTVPYPPAPDSGAEPTQPVRTRNTRSQGGAPGPDDTRPIPRARQSYPDPWNETPAGIRPPADDFYPGSASAPPQSTSPYPPAYIPPQVYIPEPPNPPEYNRGSNRIVQVLILALGALLLFACGFAFWTLTYATNAGANRLRAQVATQVADTFGGSGLPLPGPLIGPTQTAEPTPTVTAQPSPDATQAVIMEKLLSEGCKTSLDALSKLSGQIKSQPTLALDAAWRDQLSQAVDNMKANCGTLDAASPVPGMVNQAHQDLAKSQSEFDQSGKLFDEGVQNLDPGKLLEAGQHVGQAVQYLNSAITEIKKIGN